MPTVEVTQTVSLSGIGLITGLPVSATVERAPAGHGIVFRLDEGVQIPARLPAVVHTERGVTLGHPGGKTLSIVEHLLSAAAMAGLEDLTVTVSGAPELPVLDGSAQPWLEAFITHLGADPRKIQADIPLPQPVFYTHDDSTQIYALPSDRFQVTYAVDFDHPDLHQRWIRWDSTTDGIDKVAGARTFGFVRELPLLQAQGMAKGVSSENCVGLTDDGTYTDALRFEDEPIYHKILDLIGDLSLTGINPLRLQAHVFAIKTGHTTHTRFGKKLLGTLSLN